MTIIFIHRKFDSISMTEYLLIAGDCELVYCFVKIIE